MAGSPSERALDAAVRALARRELTAHELDGRLERRGFGVAERAEAVGTLARLGYLDEDRFAHHRAVELAGRGLGNAAIRDDLARRGSPVGAVDAALADLVPEGARARAQLARAGGGVRALRALAMRGFADETIEAIANELPEGVG